MEDEVRMLIGEDYKAKTGEKGEWIVEEERGGQVGNQRTNKLRKMEKSWESLFKKEAG